MCFGDILLAIGATTYEEIKCISTNVLSTNANKIEEMASIYINKNVI